MSLNLKRNKNKLRKFIINQLISDGIGYILKQKFN